MPSRPFLLVAGLALTLTAAAVVGARSLTAISRATAGHLVLVVEGDIHGLAVTHVEAKADPIGRDLQRSDWQVVVRAADGTVLGGAPIDVSKFDLEPERVGRPDRVAGDEVFTSRIAALVNVPRFVAADRLELRRGDRVVGRLDAVSYARMLREADRR